MLNDHFSGGAFLLYGLYSLQDFPKGTIRLEHNEFCHVLKMLRLKGRKDLINDKDHKDLHLQLAFVFCTFFKANALDFVLFKRQYDIEGLHYSSLIYNKKYEFDESDSEEAETKSEYSVHKVLMQIPKKLIDLEKNYFELKSEIKSVPHLNLSLEMVEEDFSTTLWKALTRVSNGEESEQADDRIGKRRRALKNRKMHALQRYSLRNIDENFDTKSEPPSPPPPPKEKKKRRHGPKFFFTNAINDPDEGADCVSETEEIIDDKAQKQEPLPDFM
ncbi:uncharacterized protein LOC128982954 isoform X2 [Macrosteles quadrilineatus]|nr:uncharacterized protein LOC128982954 isoform X2 [Macrosteles quadrilineatus]